MGIQALIPKIDSTAVTFDVQNCSVVVLTFTDYHKSLTFTQLFILVLLVHQTHDSNPTEFDSFDQRASLRDFSKVIVPRSPDQLN